MFFVALLLGFLPSFAWLYFFLREDFHPEPKRMVMLVFVAGMLSALIPIFALNQFFPEFVTYLTEGANRYHPLSVFVAVMVEELLKFFAAYLVVSRSRFFDEPIDAMIYTITAALGFAMVENVGVALLFLGEGNDVLSWGLFADATGIMLLRFAGATLLHALSSGIFGYFWARSILAGASGHLTFSPGIRMAVTRVHTLYLLLGFLFASLLHGIFNYLILCTSGPVHDPAAEQLCGLLWQIPFLSQGTLIYALIFLIIGGMFLFWDFERLKRPSKLIYE